MLVTRFAIGVFMSLSLSRRQILATTASAAGVARSGRLRLRQHVQ